MNETTCPVCKSHLRGLGPVTGDAKRYDCPNCGRSKISNTELAILDGRFKKSPVFSAILSHAIRRDQNSGEEWPFLDSYRVDKIEKDERLPSPAKQVDNLVFWLGEAQGHPGEMSQFDYGDWRARIGAVDVEGVVFIAKSAEKQNLVELELAIGEGAIRLTIDGWQRYEALKGEACSGLPTAFMAMQYNDSVLDQKIFPKFKEETKAAGFDLVKLTDVSRAGSIDEQLRDQIRRARFLVADLTHDNSGAYWEAGFAEALGKPVIYTCARSVFESEGTHFDTNHSHTILWDESDPVKAARELKTTIRATLANEARMED